MSSTLRDSLEKFLGNLHRMENAAFDEALVQMGVKGMVDKILDRCTANGNRTSPVWAIHMLLDGSYPEWVLTAKEAQRLSNPQRKTPQDFIPHELREVDLKIITDIEFSNIIDRYPDFKERMYRCLCKTETSPAWIISNLRRWLKPLWFFEYEDAVVENKAA